MNRTFIGIILLFTVLVATAVLIPSFIDLNRYRDSIAHTVESVFGRPVVIAGDVDFSIFPSPTFSIHKVFIDSVDGDSEQEFLSLDSLDIQLSLGALIGGKIQLKHAELVNPILNLDLLQNGAINWLPQLLNLNEGTISTNNGPEITLDNFIIRGGTINYLNSQKEVIAELINFDAEIAAESLLGPFSVEGNFNIGDIPLRFTLASGLFGQRRPAGIRFDLALVEGGDHLLFRGTRSIQEEKWSLKGDLILEGGDLASAMDSVVAALPFLSMNVVNEKSPYELKASVVGSPRLFKFEDIDVKIAEIGATGLIEFAIDDTPRFDAEFNFTQLNFDSFVSNRNSDQLFVGEELSNWSNILIPEALPGNIKLSAEGISYRGRIVRDARIAAEINDDKIDISNIYALLPGVSVINGTGAIITRDGAPQFDGEILLHSDNARDFLRWLGLNVTSVSQNRLNNLTYQGRVRMRPDLIQAYNFQASIDATNINGSVGIALRQRPAFSIDAHIDRLNFDSYIAVSESEDSSSQFSIKILDSFDTDIRLRMDELTMLGEQLIDLKVDLGLLSGVLTARELTVENLDGIRGTLTGITSGFSENIGGTGAINLVAGDPSSLARLFKIPMIVSPGRLGEFTFNMRVDGDQEYLNLDIGALLAGTKFRLQGDVNDIAHKPTLDLDFDAQHQNIADLFEFFGIGLGNGNKSENSSLIIKGSTKGTLGALALTLNGSIAGSEIKAAGNVSLAEELNYDLNFSLNHENGNKYLSDLGISYMPVKPLGELFLSASILGDLNNINLTKFDLLVSDTKINGNAKIQTDHSPPKLLADIITGSVDIDGFMNNSIENIDSESSRPEWSRKQVSFNFLESLDANINFRSKEITLGTLSFIKPNITIEVENGLLSIEANETTFYGGELKASVLASENPIPSIEIKTSINNLDLGKIHSIPWLFSPKSGKVVAIINLNAEGESEREFVSNMDGKITLIANNGIIEGLNFSNLSEHIENLKNIENFTPLLKTSMNSDQTTFSFIDVIATVNDGVITFDKLIADLDGASVFGRGGIELTRRMAEIDLSVSLNGELQNRPFSVELNGPLQMPRKTIRSRNLQNWVVNNIGADSPQPNPSPPLQPSEKVDELEPKDLGANSDEDQRIAPIGNANLENPRHDDPIENIFRDQSHCLVADNSEQSSPDNSSKCRLRANQNPVPPEAKPIVPKQADELRGFLNKLVGRGAP